MWEHQQIAVVLEHIVVDRVRICILLKDFSLLLYITDANVYRIRFSSVTDVTDSLYGNHVGE